MLQSNDEVLRLFDEWGRNFAPANLVQNEKNAGLLAEYVLEKYGLVSISYLNEAAKALSAAGKLALIPTLTPVQKQAEASKIRAAKDAVDHAHDHKSGTKANLAKPADTAVVDKAAAEKVEKDAKKLTDLVGQIKKQINDYIVGHSSGAADYSRSQYGRAALIQVLREHVKVTVDKDSYVTQIDAKSIPVAEKALAAVKTAKGRL
jgi:hypothetical protein